jgi:Flp pilus assembly protein TadG
MIRDERGTAALIFALTSTIALSVSGAAFDLGRMMYARSQMQSALDAAVLAGTQHYGQSGLDLTAAQAVVRNLFEAKYAGSRTASQAGQGPSLNGAPTLEFVSTTATISAEARAKVSAPFIGLVADSEVEIAVRSSGQFSVRRLDLGMMVDITGSMGGADDTITTAEGGDGTKLGALRVAGKDLLNVLMPTGDVDGVRVSVVPFSQRVWVDRPIAAAVTNKPEQRTCQNYRRRTRSDSWCTNSSWSTRSGCYTTVATCDGSVPSGTVVRSGSSYQQYLSGCMTERNGRNTTDNVPATGDFDAYYSSSATDSCSTPSKLLPLTASKQTLVDKINSLTVPNGGTAGHMGTAWAWYSISPNFSSAFTGSSAPAAYGTQNDDGGTIKAVVLMTDGDYTYHGDATDGCTGQSKCSLSRTDARALCTAMKAQSKDVLVFAVGFGLAGSETQLTPAQIAALPSDDARKVLADCAGPDRYFFPYDGTALREAFRNIGSLLSNRAIGAVLTE